MVQPLDDLVLYKSSNYYPTSGMPSKKKIGRIKDFVPTWVGGQFSRPNKFDMHLGFENSLVGRSSMELPILFFCKFYLYSLKYLVRLVSVFTVILNMTLCEFRNLITYLAVEYILDQRSARLSVSVSTIFLVSVSVSKIHIFLVSVSVLNIHE